MKQIAQPIITRCSVIWKDWRLVDNCEANEDITIDSTNPDLFSSIG